MMRKLIIAALVGLGLTFGVAAGPAAAHDAGPCTQTSDPGHSEYAQHHVVFQAHEGTLGAGGHVPGAHQGYSNCQ
jgi:hypothetical protein